MFQLLKRLCSYLDVIEKGGVASPELLLAIEETVLLADIELWTRHRWDEQETALRRYPILADAEYTMYAVPRA